jgi:hypothetical protein
VSYGAIFADFRSADTPAKLTRIVMFNLIHSTPTRKPAHFNGVAALLTLAAFGLGACNSPQDEATERQADAIEQSADSVRNSGEVAANVIEQSGENLEQKMDASGDAARDATERLADETAKMRDKQADALDASADAVREGETKQP